MARHCWDPICPEPRGLLVPVRIDPTGESGPTKHQAGGPVWRTSSKGLLVPAWVDPDRPEQRIVEQAARLPADAAVTGWAACRMHRAAFFDGLGRDGRTLLPVPVVVPDGRRLRSDRHLQVTRWLLPADEVVVRGGVRVTSVLRATFDAMRLAVDVREATVVLDMMAAARLVSIQRLGRYAAAHLGVRRAAKVGQAIELAGEHSRSPQEPRLRLICRLDAGLWLLVNCPVHDRSTGRLVAIPDLLDVEAGMGLEFDGDEHRKAARHSHDVGRESDLRDYGLEVCRVTGPDLLDPARVVERVPRARRRALVERRWVPRPLEDTLDRLLDQQEWLAQQHEAWQQEERPRDTP